MLSIAIRALLGIILCSGCAVLHRVQLSDIERQGRPVSVKISETTVDLGEAADIAKRLGRSSKSQGLQDLGSLVSAYQMLFQFGPRTGAPVYNEFYAREIPERLAATCKGGYLTNVVSMRETRSYPVIKGEIVRVDARCVSSPSR